jgi:ABC-type transport system involved in multi-copper enzyme maturation permease subunit
MMALVLKDLLIQKWGALLCVLGAPILAVAINDMTGRFSLAVTLVMAFNIHSFGAFGMDEHYRVDRFALSLPLSRPRIVAARFVSAFGIVLLSATLGAGARALAEALGMGLYPSDPESLVIAAMLLAFMALILIPLNYALGFSKARIANFVLLYGIFWLPSLIFGPRQEGSGTLGFDPAMSAGSLFRGLAALWGIEAWLVAAMGLALAMALIALAYMASVAAYARREF